MWLSPAWWPVIPMLATAVLLSQSARGHGGSITRMLWQADGSWLVSDRRGRDWPARLDPGSYVHPRLMLLRFHVNGRRRAFNVILCPDSERPEALRRLRSGLRTRYPDTDAASAGSPFSRG